MCLQKSYDHHLSPKYTLCFQSPNGRIAFLSPCTWPPNTCFVAHCLRIVMLWFYLNRILLEPFEKSRSTVCAFYGQISLALESWHLIWFRLNGLFWLSIALLYCWLRSIAIISDIAKKQRNTKGIRRWNIHFPSPCRLSAMFIAMSLCWRHWLIGMGTNIISPAEIDALWSVI